MAHAMGVLGYAKISTVKSLPLSSTDNPAVYEHRHVHAVYDQIAPHFSSTRYKPWPLISRFLLSIPTGWVGLDSGTGNGKYLPLPTDHPGKIWTIGLDRSQSLLNIARIAGSSSIIREVVRGDVLGQGWRQGAFRLLESVSSRHGRVLIYVWAIEQDEYSKRIVPVPGGETGTHTDVDGEPSTSGQDVFVPWSLSTGRARSEAPKMKEAAGNALETTPEIIQRYYHMFAKDELGQLVRVAAQEMELIVGPPPMSQVDGAEGIEIVASGWERSNYYVELQRWRR
ncbi:S-adenosyl-L-methionine-dependent methyltransferase [Lactarius deliciosus]|nr:S-adenosyl-L-methionine-dependent methyltransferase [Lactarius deliciosus]